MHTIPNNYETLSHSPENFTDEINSILSKGLTADNIDSYADQALNDLISLTGRVLRSYESAPTIRATTPRANEELAYQYFSLDNIETTLDRVADLSEEIHAIDTTIAAIPQLDKEFVPPETATIHLEASDESFKEKRLVPRLKSVLFLLQKEFQQDINNTDEVQLYTGVVNSNSMRTRPYTLVHTPNLHRLLLVNDEEGNRTFVFDTAVAEQENIRIQDLAGLSKNELKELISSNEKIGVHFSYEKNTFINQVQHSLSHELEGDHTEHSSDEEVSYLIANAPAEYLSLKKMSQQVEGAPTRYMLQKHIEDIRSELGPIYKYRFGSKTAEGLSPDQQFLLISYIENLAESTSIPSDYKSVRSFSSELGISRDTLIGMLDDLDGDMSKLQSAQSANGKSTPIVSPEQQKLIQERLQVVEDMPEGYITIRELTESLGVSRMTLRAALANTADELGELRKYKYGPKDQSVTSLSPTQQATLENYITHQQKLDSYDSILSISKISSISRHALTKTAQQLEESGLLGKVELKDGTRPIYDSRQVEIILNAIQK